LRVFGPGLLARLPLHPALAGPALWQLLPRQVIGARGIDEFPLLREISRSSRDALLQLRDLRVLVLH
jgi:hypothetical protein